MRRAVAALVVTAAAAIIWIAALPPAAVDQPVVFPHARHQGVACTVCHRGATTSARAGIPDAAFCAKCHSSLPQTIAWVQVTRLPSHVMFSHQRHVQLGQLDCASCHGEIKTRTTPIGRAQVRLVMTTCLSCHRHEGAAEDCAACHR